MQERKGIFVAGQWVVDQVKMVDHWPEPATLACIANTATGNGGYAYNLLMDLARLDPEIRLWGAGVVGDDPLGERVLRDCSQWNIHHGQIKVRDSAPTAFTDVMTEQESGRRTLFTCHGANAKFIAEDISFNEVSASIFALGYLGFLPGMDEVDGQGRNGTSQVFQAAKAAGMRTVSDLVSSHNPKLREQIDPCIPFLDILFLNEWEASVVLGVSEDEYSGNVTGLKQMARCVLDLGIHEAVILHDEKGVALALRNGGDLYQSALKLPSDFVKGSVGAGDALAAGVLTGLQNEMSWEQCLRLGVCSAASCLNAPTCSEGIRHWSECLKLYDRYATSFG